MTLTGSRAIPPFNVRMPPHLRNALEEVAKNSNRSLNAQMRQLLEVSLQNAPVFQGVSALPESEIKTGRNTSTFGLRLQDELKQALQQSAKASLRSLNTEIVLRLLHVLDEGVTSSPIPHSLKDHGELTVAQRCHLMNAWRDLSRAVDAIETATPEKISQCMRRLALARDAYAQLAGAYLGQSREIKGSEGEGNLR